MIYTGIVEDNADPRHYNRVRVRLYGVHTDQDGGKPQIPADDLPWATPMTVSYTHMTLPTICSV